MKSYKILNQGKIAEYDSANADNSKFWDTQWMKDGAKKSLEKSRNGYLGRGMDFLLDELHPDDSILEGGCGKGQIVMALQNRGFKTVGLDFAESTIKIIKEVAPELDVVCDDLRAMPFKDKSFSVYMSFGVIEHFTNKKDLDNIISEAKRVTKDRVFISVPHLSKPILKRYNNNELDKNIEDKNFYQYYFDDNEFKSLLISYGLKPYKKEYYSTYIGLKRNHKGFKFLIRFKVFRFLLSKVDGFLNQIYGKKYGHMIAYWATVPD